MIAVSRTFFWHWTPTIHRLHFGFDIYVPGIKVRFGYDGPPCRVCRKRDGILSWPLDNPGAAVCPACCEHDYERCDGDYACTECGDLAPYEWIDDHCRCDYACTECGDLAPYEWIDDHCRCDDDVFISFASSREPSEPIGTPISQLSGRPGHDGYDKFVQIAKSWGYD